MSDFNLVSENSTKKEVQLFRSLIPRSELILTGYNLQTTNGLYCILISESFLNGEVIDLENHKKFIKLGKKLNLEISDKNLIDIKNLLSYTNSNNYDTLPFSDFESLFFDNTSKSSFIIEFKSRYFVVLCDIYDEYIFKIRDFLKEKQLSFKNLDTFIRYINRTYKFKADEILGYCKLKLGFENYLSNLLELESKNDDDEKSNENSEVISEEERNIQQALQQSLRENTNEGYFEDEEEKYMQKAIEESLKEKTNVDEINCEEYCSEEEYFSENSYVYSEDEKDYNFSELSETNSDNK